MLYVIYCGSYFYDFLHSAFSQSLKMFSSEIRLSNEMSFDNAVEISDVQENTLINGRYTFLCQLNGFPAYKHEHEIFIFCKKCGSRNELRWYISKNLNDLDGYLYSTNHIQGTTVPRSGQYQRYYILCKRVHFIAFR